MTNKAEEQFQIAKSEWGEGPWQAEPDRLEFEHAGLPCLALRNRMGVWCGYTAVPPGHPLHGAKYDEAPVEVHGGLTYANVCFSEICHTPKPGEPDDVYWLGFDCGHAWDFAPAMAAFERHRFPDWPHTRFDNEVYRDLAYVRHEIESLAEQLARLASHP
jgi:hypothetical protein